MDPSQLQHFHEHGYVIVPSLLSASLLTRLRAAAERTTTKIRADITSWPHVRTVGKQFPPWTPTAADDVWGIGHLLHPALAEPVFLEYYTTPPLLAAAAALLATPVATLQMELCSLLISPSHAPFSLTWHRDSIPTPTPAAAELSLLRAPRTSIQWNTNIGDAPDDALVVVPGSHRRARTEEERAALREALPGEKRVRVGPGETVFYDRDILHRATYEAGGGRRCLHASTGRGGEVVRQHEVGWLEGVRFEGVAEGMRGRAVGAGVGGVGGVLEG